MSLRATKGRAIRPFIDKDGVDTDDRKNLRIREEYAPSDKKELGTFQKPGTSLLKTRKTFLNDSICVENIKA